MNCEICNTVSSEPDCTSEAQIIGTLNERSLHRALKEFYSGEYGRTEVKINGFTADVFDGKTVTEIQSRQFRRLKKKLCAFSLEYSVRVVYPVSKVKWIAWLNDDTGEVVSKRRSPKKGEAYDILAEIYELSDFIGIDGIVFEAALLETEEYRVLNGWDKLKKRGAEHYDKVLNEIIGSYTFSSKEDYINALPPLPDNFTAARLSKLLKRNMRFTYRTLKVLETVGAIRRCGKQGRCILYEKTQSE